MYNTLTRRVEEFVPGDPANVTFYTCGPTVYDDAHIGNFRSFLAADLLRRWIESPLCELTTADGSVHAGPRRVTHVMNITDVGHMTGDDVADGSGEDKMVLAGRRIAEAKKSGKLPAGADIDPSDPYAIAGFYADRFIEDAKKLGLKLAAEADDDPTLMPRATASIDGMIALIQRLIERGHAYVAGEPGGRVVYFDVASYPMYGRLSGNTLDRLRSGAGGRVCDVHQSQKKNPADFLLWKEDADHIMKWDSPWGTGYPGWHVECSVMAHARLADASRDIYPDGQALIDIHSGGEDNLFPHHECEIAQSCCAFNERPAEGTFARLWFHPRFLMIEGGKMSKSKGNFFTARDLFAKGHDPAAVRLELIKTHYRSNANFTMQGLKDSARMIERWRKVRPEIIRRSVAWTNTDTRMVRLLLHSNIAACMHEDLNVAGAIGEINQTISACMDREVDRSQMQGWDDQTAIQVASDPAPWSDVKRAPLDIFRDIDPVLGLLELEQPTSAETDAGVFAPGVEPTPAMIELLNARQAARDARDFAQADAIRDELAAMGFAVKDTPAGQEVSLLP
jgi:cysteinyl-tRNA synthetase